MAPTPPETQPPSPDAGLSIGELAERTGVRPATLRAWESRFGFPRPERLSGGHRRYAESTVEAVRAVARQRHQGIRLDAAIAGLDVAVTDPGPHSVFRELSREASNPVHRLAKPTLVALSHAIEDEFCARAATPFLFGAFQTAHHYRHSQHRWAELARTSRSTTVLADFGAHRDWLDGPRVGDVRLVSLPPDTPMHREWVVVCDAPDLAVCLSAWELPGQAHTPDSERLFEATWTVDPVAVRRAARVCTSMAVAAGAPGAASLAAEVQDAPRAGHADLDGTIRLFDRFVTYLDRTSRRLP